MNGITIEVSKVLGTGFLVYRAWEPDPERQTALESFRRRMVAAEGR